MSEASELLRRAIEALENVVGTTTSETPASPPHPSANASAGSSPSDADALPLYQSKLVDSFLRSPGNEILFLPTGLGECAVTDAIARGMLERHPSKHIVVCVVRPAQALSHANRLRAALGVPVGAFCGGDFLYNFEEEFKHNRVLVFTAGLLMRLTKLGTYQLSSASLLVLHDAFSAVRNHPMNTLVREYYWKGPGGEAGVERPRILGVVLPQLQQLQRPFDKLRQLVRKLCHSAQAGVLVPTGPALESLAARVHRAHVAVHAYPLTMEERELGEALQTHSLLVWDILHAFGQNHFGRLIHFPPAASPQQSPRTTGASAGAGAGSQQDQAMSHTARLVASLAAAAGSPAGSPAGVGSPASLGSPALAETPRAAALPGSVAPPNAAPYAFDPVHHDWLQIELMVRHSIACSEALPAEGTEHVRSDVAIGVMQHVLLCAMAVRTHMELGVQACLAALVPALTELVKLVNSAMASDNSVDSQLQEKLLEVLPTSPLLLWLTTRELPSPGEGSLSSDQPRIGSRMEKLLELLREVLRHAEEEELFVNKLKLCRVAVVVGDDAAAAAVQRAVQAAPDLCATISRWNAGEESDQLPEQTNETHKLAIVLLTAAEAASPSGRARIAASNEAVWFSAADVLHAAGFDFESAALSVFCRESAVGAGTDAQPGPECHVLATEQQTAAWLEVCRADQLLLAAMQLVQAGDASFEGYLGQLIAGTAGSSAAMAVPPPATVLHTLCLGLCGRPPVFSLSSFQGNSERERLYQAVAVLPEEMLAPGNYALPVAFGSEEICFQGHPAESESEARDSSAEAALGKLLECGLVAAYWQTRALLVQSQHMAAEKSAAGIPMRHLSVVSTHGQDLLPPSPFVDSSSPMQGGGGRPSSPSRRPGGDHGAGVPSENLICPICGIVTTSEGHLKEHLAGRRHQKNLERLQQQGMAHLHLSIAGGGVKRGDGQGDEEEEEEPNTPPAGGATATASASAATTPGVGGPLSSGSSTPAPQLATLSTIDRLPSSLSDAFLRRSSSLHRNPSGNVYDGFPCVRVGDVVLPSSMDLRAFLEEMQQVGDLEPFPEPLPPIEEVTGSSDKRPGEGGTGGGPGVLSPGSDSKSGGGAMSYRERSGRPPPPPRPNSSQRVGHHHHHQPLPPSSNVYTHHHNLQHHHQQYPQQQYQQAYQAQQAQQGWSPQRRGNARPRYPSRFGSQDPGNIGGGSGGANVQGYNAVAPHYPGMQYPPPMPGYHQAHQMMQHGHPVAYVPAIPAYPTAIPPGAPPAGMGMAGQVYPPIGGRMGQHQQPSYYYTMPMGQHQQQQQHGINQGWRQHQPPPSNQGHGQGGDK